MPVSSRRSGTAERGAFPRLCWRRTGGCPAGTRPGSGQEATQDLVLGRARLGDALHAVGRDARVDAATVVRAGGAAGQARLLQARDEPREGRLTDVDLVGQLLDAAAAVPLRVGQAGEHLEL